MVSNGQDDRDMHLQNAKLGFKTGLALAPFCAHTMDASLDWTVTQRTFSHLMNSRDASLLVLPGDGMLAYWRVMSPGDFTWLLRCQEGI